MRLQPLDLAYFSATVEADLGEPAQKVVQARTLKAQAALSGLPDSAPLWIQQLAVAADQFIVRRGEVGAGRRASSRAIPGLPIGAATP